MHRVESVRASDLSAASKAFRPESVLAEFKSTYLPGGPSR
jgi:hypothetical protein